VVTEGLRESATGEDGLVDALVHTAFVTMGVLSKAGADHDLSLTQLRVLGILRDRRLRMAALAEFLGLEKSTMTGLVDRAEKRGLVQRAPNAGDGRAVDVFLSPAGHSLAAQVADHVARALAPVTGGLGAADRRRLRVLLDRMLVPHQP
jgi:DNA-binding MarR family transcriptional regulator